MTSVGIAPSIKERFIDFRFEMFNVCTDGFGLREMEYCLREINDRYPHEGVGRVVTPLVIN